MGSCPKCVGSGKILNPEYDRAFDREDGIGQKTPSQINSELARRGIQKDMTCPRCNGRGTVDN